MRTKHVEHGRVVTSEAVAITEHFDPDDVTIVQRPFIGDAGQVGCQFTHQDGRVEYLYFNPSAGGDASQGANGGPGFNTFVYQGTTGDPTEDAPLHFYYVFDPEDWEEPDDINRR